MFNRSYKQELYTFAYLYKVQFFYWKQNKMNLFLGLGISLYTMVCWLAFKSADPFLMISGISVGLVRNAMYIPVKTVGDWRDKKLSDRLNLTPASNLSKNAAPILFNISSTVAICLVMLIVALIFFPDQRTNMINANQGMVWAGLILAWITSYFVGYAIVTWIPNTKMAQMVGLLLYFSTMYFMGLAFPFDAILNYDWLSDVLFAHPFRYTMNIVQAGYIDSPNFIFEGKEGWFGGKGIDFGYGGRAWLPYILATSMILFFAIAYYLKVFHDGAFHKRNKYGKFIVNKSSSRYIHRLKTSQSIEELKVLHRDHLEVLSKKSPKMNKIIQQIQREVRLEEWFKIRKNKEKEEK